MVQYAGRRPQSVHEALLTLDPQAFDVAREHLNENPPPPYASSESTTLMSPELPGNDLQNFERELDSTRPESRFYQDIHDEIKVIEQAIELDEILDHKLRPCREIATAIIRERWIAQGIWSFNDRGPHSHSNWKHSVVDAGYHSDRLEPKAARGSLNIFGSGAPGDGVDRKAQRAALAPNIDASRPCNQFEHDLAEEQRRLKAGEQPDGIPDMVYKRVQEEWMKLGMWSANYTQQPEYDLAVIRHRLWLQKKERLPGPNSPIQGMAYANVKAKWIRDGRWDSRWTDRPGRVWRHEQPEEMARLRQLGGIPDRGALSQDNLKTAGLRPPSPPTQQWALPDACRPRFEVAVAAADVVEDNSGAAVMTRASTVHGQPLSPPKRRSSRPKQPTLAPAGSPRVAKSKRKPDHRCQKITVRESAILARQLLT